METQQYAQKILRVGKALLAAYVVTAVCLLTVAFLLLKLDLSQSNVSVGIIVTYLVSCFLGGFILGKTMERRKFLWGMVLGIITLGENGLETAIGTHIANNIIVTSLGNGLSFLGDYPSLLTSGTSLGVPYFILPFILLALVFWGKKDKLSLIFKTHWRLSDPYPVATEIQCVNCKTINPEIANYCRECGEPLLIEYASTPRKVLAFLIDLTLLTIVSLVLMGVIFLMVYLNPYSFSPGLASGVWLILSTLIFFVYPVLMEKNGKTVGKMITGLRVVDEYTLKPISYRQSILRNVMLIADLFPFILPGLLGLIVSAKSDEKQRMGDMAAETIVIWG